MRNLTNEERRIKRALKMTLNQMKESSMDWYVKIKKYRSGGIKFYIYNVIFNGLDYIIPFYQNGNCKGDSAEVDLAFERPSIIRKDYLQGILCRLNDYELYHDTEPKNEPAL